MVWNINQIIFSERGSMASWQDSELELGERFWKGGKRKEGSFCPIDMIQWKCYRKRMK